MYPDFIPKRYPVTSKTPPYPFLSDIPEGITLMIASLGAIRMIW